MKELECGRVLRGRYCVERLVARGGMGRLYQGYPVGGAGRVAIKELDATGTLSPEDVAQFKREHELLRNLSHPGLARVLDFFEEGGCHYLVEEFVPGSTLEEHLETVGRLPCDEAVSVIEQVLFVLEYLHAQGIVYRDLKPHNLIMQPRPSDGEERPSVFPFMVRLVDFGAARRWRSGAVSDTVPMGTPGFAAPEQYGTAQSDGRTDLYSAGVLLHYALTGTPPDPTQGWGFKPPHDLVPTVPVALGQVVLQAVEVDRDRRFQDSAAMRKAILQAVGRPESCPRCGAELPPTGDCPCLPPPLKVGARVRSALSWGLLIGLVLLVGKAIIVPSFIRTRAQWQWTACKSNLKNIGTALEMYSTDNGGRFPRSPVGLTPNYLEQVPTCPAKGSDTYSEGFASASNPDAYTVVCAGRNHSGVGLGENFPQYTSTQGVPSQ